MITLLDYGAGNVRSVVNAVERLGETIKPAKTAEDILSAEKLLFPGVGAFGAMMEILHQKGFAAPLAACLREDRPFLGICLGMHALFEGSEEAPDLPGLGLLKGRVKRFETDLAVPHIGWNGISPRQPSPLFAHLRGDEKFYFVHSYHIVPEVPGVVLTCTDYGYRFASAVQKGRMRGVQFHPEKSGEAGAAMLRGFIEDAPARLPEIRAEKTALARRIIACLDVRGNDQGDLVVTKGDQYDVREGGNVRNLGKPVELARRYYEEGADEITFLNITGFRDFPLEDMPMLEVLRRTSKTVFVPLTIGGGIRNFTDAAGRSCTALEVASEYFRSGADKVSIGSDAVAIAMAYRKSGVKTGRSAIEEIARVYGSQAVVISVDPRRVYVRSPEEAPEHIVIPTVIPGPAGERFCWYQCTVQGGRKGENLDAVTLSRLCAELGAGEILLNCIDRDGANSGFDIELIRAVKSAVGIPVIASSGAGCAAHFLEVFEQTTAESALAAGIFHRREVPVGEVKSFLRGKVEIRN